jgi:hypothetical protein
MSNKRCGKAGRSCETCIEKNAQTRIGLVCDVCEEGSQYVAAPPKASRRKFPVSGTLDMDSHFYLNCRAQRRHKSRCCDSCPFRSGIEEAERENAGMKRKTKR